MNSKDIINRIKEQLNFSTDKELAEKLNMKPSLLSNWKKRGTFKLDILTKFEHKLDFNWILTGQYKYPNSQKENKSIEYEKFIDLQIKGIKPPIIFVEEKVEAGYLKGFHKSQNNELNFLIMSHQNYKDGNKYRFFEIRGDSMEPKLLSGDCIFCEKKDKYEIKQGIVYLWHTKDGLICKRLSEIQEEEFILNSDNEKYPPLHVPKYDILEIWEVKETNRKLK